MLNLSISFVNVSQFSTERHWRERKSKTFLGLHLCLWAESVDPFLIVDTRGFRRVIVGVASNASLGGIQFRD